jgi:hypothetical protein
MQHNKLRETNEMAIQVENLTSFDMLRLTQSFRVIDKIFSPSLCPRVCPRDNGQVQGPHAARSIFRATQARDNPLSILFETCSVRVWRRPLAQLWSLCPPFPGYLSAD